ncbi:MAG TPA: VWA domain-containing protein [Pyrinomonadaceae bacterium]|nr:VWA domain-containing protein [Pyrinomonadaceae bacterium]
MTPSSARGFLRAALVLLLCLATRAAFAQESNVKGDAQRPAPAPSASPASVVFVFDLSMSMSETRQMNKALLEEVSRLIATGPRENEYFIVGVSTTPELLLDSTTDAGATLRAVNRVGEIRPEGASALYDACFLAVTKLLAGHHDRKFMLVFSDGEDTISDRSPKEVLTLLSNKGVTVYAVNVRKPGNIEAVLRAVAFLEKITSRTGGKAFNAYQPGRLSRVFEELKEKLWD